MTDKNKKDEGSIQFKKIKFGSRYKRPDTMQVLNPDPSRSYRLISKKRATLDCGMGADWQPITAENSKGEGLNGLGYQTSGDSKVEVGDLVLAFIPKEVAEARKLALRDENVTAAREAMSVGGLGPHVSVFEETLTGEAQPQQVSAKDETIVKRHRPARGRKKS